MRLRTLLLAAVGYVLVLAVVALEVPLAVSLRDRVDAEVRAQASSQADVLAATASDLLAPGQRDRLRSLVAASAGRLRGRVLVVDGHGRVLVDSGRPHTSGQDFSGRPEVAAALRGRPRQVRRHSTTLATDLLATAVPVVAKGRAVGAVRVTQNLAAVRSAERRTLGALVLIGGVVLAIGLLAGVVLAARIAGPVRRLEATARRVADGDLDARTVPEGSAEQRSLAHSVNVMTERLAELLARQRRFVADASHQLRTPLTGLRLRLENLRAGIDRGVAPAPAELDAALEEVDRLAIIVSDLLELSRAEREGAAGEGVTTDAISAARRAAERWAPQAAAEGGRVLVDVQADVARAPWSDTALDRMLDALVENALLYGGSGPTVRVVVDADALAVEDDGPGIALDERELVFERFHRGRGAQGAVAGTGLGLAIVRELAERGGGRATLRERPGGGTVAVLDFGARDRAEVVA
jgi:signal transduction histidine kinase